MDHLLVFFLFVLDLWPPQPQTRKWSPFLYSPYLSLFDEKSRSLFWTSSLNLVFLCLRLPRLVTNRGQFRYSYSVSFHFDQMNCLVQTSVVVVLSIHPQTCWNQEYYVRTWIITMVIPIIRVWLYGSIVGIMFVLSSLLEVILWFWIRLGKAIMLIRKPPKLKPKTVFHVDQFRSWV